MSSGWPPEEDNRRWEPVRHASVVGAGHDSRGADRGYSGYAGYPADADESGGSGPYGVQPSYDEDGCYAPADAAGPADASIPPAPCPARTATAGSAVRAFTGPRSTRRRTIGEPAPGTRSTRTACMWTSSTLRRRMGRLSTGRPGTARLTSPVRRATPETSMTSSPMPEGAIPWRTTPKLATPRTTRTAAIQARWRATSPAGTPGTRPRLPAGRVPGSLIPASRTTASRTTASRTTASRTTASRTTASRTTAIRDTTTPATVISPTRTRRAAAPPTAGPSGPAPPTRTRASSTRATATSVTAPVATRASRAGPRPRATVRRPTRRRTRPRIRP